MIVLEKTQEEEMLGMYLRLSDQRKIILGAVLSGLGMSMIVGVANSGHGVVAFAVAWIKQFMYSFSVAILFLGLIKFLVRILKYSTLARLSITTLVVWILAMACSYVLHVIIPGTAESYLSFYLSASISPVATIFIAWETIQSDRIKQVGV